jgi:hypothetical protein
MSPDLHRHPDANCHNNGHDCPDDRNRGNDPCVETGREIHDVVVMQVNDS